MRFSMHAYAFFACCMIMCAAADATSQDYTAVTECEKHFILLEREYNLPPGMLRAVGTHESGKYLKAHKRKAAWPWTINVLGKGFYFSEKKDALTAIDMHMRGRGIRSVDIGCMQVNMLYHGHAFKNNPRKAIIPSENIRYGAKFLRSRYDVSDSWEEAIGNYHNMIPSIGRRYSKKIIAMWKKQQPDFSYGYLAKHERTNNGLTSLVYRIAPRAVSEATSITFSTLSRFYSAR